MTAIAGTDVASTSVTAVWASPLPPLNYEAVGVLPSWGYDAVQPPSGRLWPENLASFAVHVCDSAGQVGSFGPCSDAVLRIIRDQVAPAVLDSAVTDWRALPGWALQGRHTSGAHARIAVSAIELALWDLRSRSMGMPVTSLLGGRTRASVPAYATCFGIDVDHPLAGEIASWVADAGFWAQKWYLPGCARGEEPAVDATRLTRLRSAVGSGARIAIDTHGEWNRPYAQRMLPILADHSVAWLEEAGPGVAGRAERYGVPIAGGEHGYDPDSQLSTLTSHAVDIWQPDVGWNGGLASTLQLADLAAQLGIQCLPHGGTFLAGIQLACLLDPRWTPAVEYHLTLEPVRQSITTSPITPAHGRIALPDTLGLGLGYHVGEGDLIALGGVER